MIVRSIILKIHTVDDNPLDMKVGANDMDEVLVECVPNFSEGRDTEIIEGKCVYSGDKSERMVLFAKAY